MHISSPFPRIFAKMFLSRREIVYEILDNVFLLLKQVFLSIHLKIILVLTAFFTFFSMISNNYAKH